MKNYEEKKIFPCADHARYDIGNFKFARNWRRQLITHCSIQLARIDSLLNSISIDWNDWQRKRKETQFHHTISTTKSHLRHRPWAIRNYVQIMWVVRTSWFLESHWEWKNIVLYLLSIKKAEAFTAHCVLNVPLKKFKEAFVCVFWIIK